MFGRITVRIASSVALSFLPCLLWAAPSQKKPNPDRPALPDRMLGLHREDIAAYDSKAEPVAALTEALLAVNRTGWDLIHKYFPNTGTSSTGSEKRVHPEDPTDRQFFGNYANEDASFSPMPLLCMIWSLPEAQISGPVRDLHTALVQMMTLEDYSNWKVDDLRRAVDKLTGSATTGKAVKYRTPKAHLSLGQALQLYAMSLALVRSETKWATMADSPPPDMADFTSRLKHQLPRQIPDGETVRFFLYLPADVGQPLAKGEFEERADVVTVKRKGTTFDLEQFPVYLTVRRSEWDPSWIEPKDEINDTSLPARKYEHDWTRLDGPYLWFRPDQLNGEILYRATIRFQASDMVIEAERSIERRGAAKRTDRPADYDPAKMTPFVPGVDTAAVSVGPWELEAAGSAEQLNSVKWLTPYFSSGFRAWCAYGRWTTGRTDDGRTWVVVDTDVPRPGSPVAIPASANAPESASVAPKSPPL